MALGAVLLAAAACVGPGPERAPEPTQETQVADTSIIAAQEALTPSVMDLPGVTGTAVGLCGDEPCIKVYLAAPSRATAARIPSTFRGFPVDVEVIGEIRARDTPG